MTFPPGASLKPRASGIAGVRSLRRGGAYVLVLGVAMIVFTVGVGALTIVRLQTRAMDDLNDAAEARLYAQSAIDLARLAIVQDPNWRDTWSNGTWVSNRAIGRGTYSIDGFNPNGSLNRSPADPVVLIGTGIKGRAVQKVQVMLNAQARPFGCMSTAMTAGTNIDIKSSIVNANYNVIAAAGNISASGAMVTATTEAGGAVTGSTYIGRSTSGAAARSLPTSQLFDYYKANGVWISTWSMQTNGWKISKRLLSPNSNPFGGATSPQGIYVINCNGNKITIEDSRIVGTLVLLNAHSDSRLSGCVNMAPAVSNFPCLIVQGGMTFELSTSSLSESSGNVNYNLAGTPYPYPDGVSNGSTGDSYPTQINGIVYITGNIVVRKPLMVGGLMAGGSITVEGTLTLNYQSLYASDPPPGFYEAVMTVKDGSWKPTFD